MKKIPIYRNRAKVAEALVDDKIYHIIKDHYWGLTDQGYAIRYYHPVKYGKRQSIRMHRYIINAQDDDIVDHINGNRLDNRLSNLRIVTDKQNNENRTKRNRNNKSGHRGVSWHKDKQKWRVTVMHNYKQYYGGCFDDINDAIRAAQLLRDSLGFTKNLP